MNRIWYRCLEAVVPAGIAFLILAGCGKTTTIIEPVDKRHWIDIEVPQYARNYYFVDTLYRRFWEPLHASPVPEITGPIMENLIVAIDVWKTVPQLNPTVSGIAVEKRAFVTLPPHRFGEVYQPGFVDGLDTTSAGNYQHSYWSRLEPWKDYEYDPYGGYVVFTRTVDDAQAYAVSYTILGPLGPSSGHCINMVYGDTTADGTGYLKLIKPVYISRHPEFKPAWDLMLKNIYPIGSLGFYNKVDMQITRRDHNYNSVTTQLYGHSLLEVVGLDRYDSTYTSRPDGVFDYIRGLTIDVYHGDIIFPTLRPFDTGISEFFQRLHISVPDSLRYPLVYDTTYDVASANLDQNKYYIQVAISVRSN